MNKRSTDIRVRRTAILALAGLALLPAAAEAGSNGAGEIAFPTQVTVGQTGIPASISMENRNTFPDDAQTNGVCNLGDGSPPCDSPEPGVELVPTCKQVAAGRCTAAGADPGVFQLSSQGVGRQGSVCAGTLFAISPPDPITGAVRFDPLPAGTHVMLAGFGAKCVIDFTFAVLRSPTGDQDDAPGIQTAQAMRHDQWTGPFGPTALSFAGRTTSNAAPTVLRATPAIATNASPGVRLGGQLSDQAMVTGLVGPVAGSTVTFNLFPPAAGPGCAGAPVFSSTKAVTIAGTTAAVASDPFTPAEAGTYRWTATFNGDVNNAPVTGACNEPTETREVTPPPTTTTVGGSCAPTDGPSCVPATARITGKSGCVSKAFVAAVRGTHISRVLFVLDGKRAGKALQRPDARGRFVLRLTPRAMRLGVHRVLARITFDQASGTASRTLRVTFSRCAATTRKPVFTG